MVEHACSSVARDAFFDTGRLRVDDFGHTVDGINETEILQTNKRICREPKNERARCQLHGDRVRQRRRIRPYANCRTGDAASADTPRPHAMVATDARVLRAPTAASTTQPTTSNSALPHERSDALAAYAHGAEIVVVKKPASTKSTDTCASRSPLHELA